MTRPLAFDVGAAARLKAGADDLTVQMDAMLRDPGMRNARRAAAKAYSQAQAPQLDATVQKLINALVLST